MRVLFRVPLLVAAFLAGALLLVACGGGDGETSTAADASDQGDGASAEGGSETLILPTVDGGQLDFNDLEGQDTVLWFWAPW